MSNICKQLMGKLNNYDFFDKKKTIIHDEKEYLKK